MRPAEVRAAKDVLGDLVAPKVPPQTVKESNRRCREVSAPRGRLIRRSATNAPATAQYSRGVLVSARFGDSTTAGRPIYELNAVSDENSRGKLQNVLADSTATHLGGKHLNHRGGDNRETYAEEYGEPHLPRQDQGNTVVMHEPPQGPCQHEPGWVRESRRRQSRTTRARCRSRRRPHCQESSSIARQSLRHTWWSAPIMVVDPRLSVEQVGERIRAQLMPKAVAAILWHSRRGSQRVARRFFLLRSRSCRAQCAPRKC